MLEEDTLFRECIDALKDNITILSKEESDAIFELFEKRIPFTQGSRIEWGDIKIKSEIKLPHQIISILKHLLHEPVNDNVHVLWNDASVPVIKTDLVSIINSFDDVISVGFETWMVNFDQGYVIEYYYLGEMSAGLI